MTLSPPIHNTVCLSICSGLIYILQEHFNNSLLKILYMFRYILWQIVDCPHIHPPFCSERMFIIFFLFKPCSYKLELKASPGAGCGYVTKFQPIRYVELSLKRRAFLFSFLPLSCVLDILVP
jgi:hypothetical protein